MSAAKRALSTIRTYPTPYHDHPYYQILVKSLPKKVTTFTKVLSVDRHIDSCGSQRQLTIWNSKEHCLQFPCSRHNCIRIVYSWPAVGLQSLIKAFSSCHKRALTAPKLLHSKYLMTTYKLPKSQKILLHGINTNCF